MFATDGRHYRGACVSVSLLPWLTVLCADILAGSVQTPAPSPTEPTPSNPAIDCVSSHVQKHVATCMARHVRQALTTSTATFGGPQQSSSTAPGHQRSPKKHFLVHSMQDPQLPITLLQHVWIFPHTPHAPLESSPPVCTMLRRMGHCGPPLPGHTSAGAPPGKVQSGWASHTTAIPSVHPSPRGVLNREKKTEVFRYCSFLKRPRVPHVFNRHGLAVGG